jgi:Phosphatidylserine/phosphatidylglycerophosphate/cardiolipin synthases and related enzymes
VAAWTLGVLRNKQLDPERQPKLEITTYKSVREMTAAVSPDCSFGLVKEAIDSAKREVCLYIYDASADHMLDLLRAAKHRNVHIRLMYDVTDTRRDKKAKLKGLGVELKEAPSTGGRVFTVCHQKFAVIDDSILLLGSANWATSSIPMIAAPGQFKKGNREWLIRIDQPSVAKWFKRLFIADWEIPEVEQPPAAMAMALPAEEVFFAPAMPEQPEKIFAAKHVDLSKPASVTPIISPNNYASLLRKLIREAKTSVYIEQQYILAGGPTSEGILGAPRDRKGDRDEDHR